VTALAVCDVRGDGRPALLCGGADSDLRAFRGSEVVFEASETDAVTSVAPLGGGAFAYALSNGTVGVYSAAAAAAAAAAAGGSGLLGAGGLPPARAWRVKAKGRCVAVAGFDFDGDGEEEVAALWASGKLEVRRAQTGELLFREQLEDAGAGRRRS
jgi:Bardet-Biedl syndrome 2 protein